MFYKKLENGKFRYFEKYFNQRELKWKQVTVTLNGKTRASQNEARNRLAQKIEEAQTRQHALETKVAQARVGEVFKEWTALRAQEVQLSTYETERALLKGFLKEFSDWQVREIQTVHVQNYLISQDIKNSTRRNVRAKLNMFFSYMEKLGYVTSNPLEKVVLPRESLTLEEFENKQSKFFSRDEMAQFLAYMQENCLTESQVRKRLLAEFLYLTGLRISEALALRFTSPYVDFENQTLYIRYSLDKHSYQLKEAKLSKTKTPQSIRTISINTRCVEILKWFQEANEKFESDYVFLDTKEMFISPRDFNYFLKVAGLKAAIAGKNPKIFSAHMFRHSHISLLAELGVSQKATMERVGHSNPYTTNMIYTHVTQTMRDEVSQKLENLSL